MSAKREQSVSMSAGKLRAYGALQTRCLRSQLTCHRIRNLDLAADNLLLRFFDLLNHFGSDQVFVVFVHRIADAVFVQTINVEAGLNCPFTTS